MDPTYKPPKNKLTTNVRTNIPVTSMVDGKKYNLELNQRETMRKQLNYRQIQLINEMVENTPSVKVGLEEITETLFSQPFNLTLVKNDISNTRGTKRKSKQKDEKATTFGDVNSNSNNGSDGYDDKLNESIKNLNNDIKLDDLTSRVMKDHWLPALKKMKTNIDKYGFSPFYLLEKPISITTYVKVAKTRPSSGTGEKRSRDDFEGGMAETEPTPDKSKRIKTRGPRIIDESKDGKQIENGNYSADSDVNHKDGQKIKNVLKIREEGDAFKVGDILADNGVLVKESMIERLGVTIPKNEDYKVSTTLIAREDTGITPGVPFPQTGGSSTTMKYPSIKDTYMGGIPSEKVEKINLMEEEYMNRALSGTFTNTLESFEKDRKKIENYNPNIQPSDVVHINPNEPYKDKSSTSTEVKYKNTEKLQQPVETAEPRKGASKSPNVKNNTYYEIVKKITTVNHKIPVVPPFSMGSVETYWTIEGQKLVWVWKTQDRGGGTIEPTMLWVVHQMPTLEGEIRSSLTILLKDYMSVKSNESRLRDVQEASFNPIYSIEKTEGKDKDSTKSGLDGDFYTSLMNPNYTNPVLNTSNMESGEFGDRPRGFMSANDPQGHNYWDQGTLQSSEASGDVPLSVAMANYLNGRGPKPPNWMGSEDEESMRSMLQTKMMQRDTPVASVFFRPVVQNQYGTFIRLGFNEKITRIDKPIQYDTSDLENAKKRLDISAGIATSRPLGSLLSPHEKGSGGNVFTSKSSDLSSAPQIGLAVTSTSHSPVTDFVFSNVNKLKQSYSEIIRKIFKLAYSDVYKEREGWYKDILEKTFSENPKAVTKVIGDPDKGDMPSFESLFSVKVTMPSSGSMDMTKLLELWRFGLIDTEDFILNIPDNYQAFEKPSNYLQLRQNKSGSTRNDFDQLVKKVDGKLKEAKAFEVNKLKTNDGEKKQPTTSAKPKPKSKTEAKPKPKSNTQSQTKEANNKKS